MNVKIFYEKGKIWLKNLFSQENVVEKKALTEESCAKDFERIFRVLCCISGFIIAGTVAYVLLSFVWYLFFL